MQLLLSNSTPVHQIHYRASQKSALTLLSLFLGCFSLFHSGAVLFAQDDDLDGMNNEYENFFLLNPTNASDALLNYDTDTLTNVQEAAIWTDPFVGDTDWDSWHDGIDSNPLSRAVFYWGDPDLTLGNAYTYTGPEWWLGALKDGGEWTNSAWHVSSGTSNDLGKLLITLDRSVLNTDLVISVEFTDHSGSSLYIDLLDTNNIAVVTNLYGNIIAGTDATVEKLYAVPIAVNGNAAIIQIRRGAGEITILESLLYVDIDADGFDAEQEAQIGTSDEDVDTDSDGLKDDLETLYGRNPSSADSYPSLPFEENFETNTVNTGELDGQNDWQVDTTGVASVQTSDVYEGSQALSLSGTPPDVTVVQTFLSSEQVVWVDFYQQIILSAQPTGSVQAAAAFYVNSNGFVTVFDGSQTPGSEWTTVTHPAISNEAWVRFTTRLNYVSQRWEVFLNGLPIASDIGFGESRERFTAFRLRGGQDNVDAIMISSNLPSGLSQDGDSIPDDWEVTHIGSTVYGDDDDYDVDGLGNLNEYLQSTDPDDQDSDNDGMSDGVEVLRGLGPLTTGSYFRIDVAAATNLWNTGFENAESYTVGALDGQEGWAASSGVSIVSSEAYAGTQSVELDPVSGNTISMNANVGAVGEDVVWVGFYAQIVETIPPSIPSEDLAVVAFMSDSRLVVYDSSVTNWVSSSAQFSPDLNGWYRIDAQLNFSNQVFNAWVNGVRAIEDVPFKDEINSFSHVKIRTGKENGFTSSTFVDELYFSTQEPSSDLDNDNDGLSNADEVTEGTQVDVADSDGDLVVDGAEVSAGTNPLDVDSDNDGMDDGVEDLYGQNPLVAQSHTTIPWTENFETNTVVEGELDSQNSWVASPAAGALVQTNWVQGGDQALLTGFNFLTTDIHQLFTVTNAPTVWMDMYQLVYGGILPTSEVHGATAFYFSESGQLNLFDGSQDAWSSLSNHRLVGTSDWVRLSVEMDYSNQVYSLYLDGTPLVADQAFANYRSGFSVLAFEGGLDLFDAIQIQTNRPTNLSLDEDTLPDSWETNHWPNLLSLPTEDPDSDGLDNLGEYLAFSDPEDDDSDNDGMLDGYEVTHGLNPNADDTGDDLDGDGLSNGAEHSGGTSPSNADSDGDGMTDGWEVAYSLDPLDDTDASTDADSDGLTNLEEFLAGSNPTVGDTDGDGLLDDAEVNTHLTDPANEDTDGDGMTDGWEVTHSSDPLVWNPNDDLDKDLLSNLAEFLAGTDPNDADSDNDGELDGFEVNQAGSNPLITDFDGTYSTIEGIDGTNTVGKTGDWGIYQETLYSIGWGGSLDYTIPVATAGQYAVEIVLSQFDPDAFEDSFFLNVLADGISLGEQRADATFGTETPMRWVLPYQEAGTVDLSLNWRYQVGNGSLRMHSISLITLGGPDTNLNGQADWIDHRSSTLAQLNNAPQESPISPVCFEGESLVIETVGLMVDTQSLVIVQGVGNAWYANIELSETQTVDVTVSALGTALQTNTITWSVWNLMQASTNALKVRIDDALLLQGFPSGATNGTVDLTVVGVTNYSSDIQTPVPHQFTTEGVFTIDAVWTGSTTVSTQMTVEVVHSEFADPAPAVWEGRTRNWACPDVPYESSIEYDHHVTVTQSELSSGGTEFQLSMNEPSTRRLVVRLSEDGPILDAAVVQGFELDSNNLDLTELHTWEDGTRLVRTTVSVSDFVEGMEVVLDIFTSGIYFADGSTELYLTADDFDALGQAVVYFIVTPEKTGGICHRIQVFSG